MVIVKKLLKFPKKLEEELFLIDNQYNLKQRLDNLEHFVDILNATDNTNSLDKFFMLMMNIFEKNYINPIKDVLNTFPEDLTNESGSLFWSGKKLKPKIINIADIDVTFAQNIYDIISNSFPLKMW